jgi:hypothetical protein
MMITTPSTRLITVRYSYSTWPTDPATTPVITKITANPRTKPAVPSSIRLLCFGPSMTSAAPSPVA